MEDRVADPWNTHYRLLHAASGSRVVSAGPDRRFGTSDDLQASLPPKLPRQPALPRPPGTHSPETRETARSEKPSTEAIALLETLLHRPVRDHTPPFWRKAWILEAVGQPHVSDATRHGLHAFFVPERALGEDEEGIVLPLRTDGDVGDLFTKITGKPWTLATQKSWDYRKALQQSIR